MYLNKTKQRRICLRYYNLMKTIHKVKSSVEVGNTYTCCWPVDLLAIGTIKFMWQYEYSKKVLHMKCGINLRKRWNNGLTGLMQTPNFESKNIGAMKNGFSSQ